MGCSKKFTSKDFSILCTVCGLWIHKQCAGVTDEIFDFLDKQMKATGVAYWACRPCTVYAQGMNHRMRGIEEELKEVKKVNIENSTEIKKVEEKVRELGEEVKKKGGGVTKEEFEAYKRERRDESRERKARALNVVLHGVVEKGDEGATGAERWDWDIASCRNLFKELNLRITEENIKFCRRVGERGGDPRPMIIGLFNERDRGLLLSQDTRNTCFSDVTIGPDLTKEQRREEADMRKEMEEKNRNLTEEDLAKNLAWRMVGPRGERRLLKGVVREQGNGGRGAQRGGPRRPGSQQNLPPVSQQLLPSSQFNQTRGGSWNTTMATRSRRTATATTRGGTTQGMTGRERMQSQEMLEEGTEEEMTGRSRLASHKRKERETAGDDSMESEPPAKH